jgi:hypothetical protein
MANRLKKLAEVRYTPGTPYQPFVPGYCIQVAYTVPGYQTFDTVYVLDENGQLVRIDGPSTGYVNPSTKYIELCFPAQPEIRGTLATTTYTAITGWNGGARSVDQLDNDGYFEFQIRDVPSGTVVGLSTTDVTTLPSEPTHAVYAHSTTLDIMESGVVVHTAPVAHDYDNTYRIQRIGLTVTYSGPGWSYESLTPAAGARFLDATMYASGEFVDNPTLTLLEFSGTASGSLRSLQGYGYGRQYDGVTTVEAVGSLAAMDGRGYEGTEYAAAYGTLGAMQGEASETPSYAAAYGTLGTLTGEAGVVFVTSGGGTLQALVGVASEGEYNYGGGSLRALTGTADGGYPQVNLIFGIGSFSPMAGASHGLTGEVGTVVATLGALGGWASEGPYAEVFGTLGAMRGYADSGWPVPGETYAQEVMLVGDFFLAQDVQLGSITSSLDVGDFFDDVIIIEDAIYDSLMLSDSVTATQAIEAVIAMSLLLGNDISNLIDSQETSAAGRLIGAEPAQYAVNVLTSALTNYSGFNFTAFASVDQTLYGAKTDGVYRARAGDDDGTGLNAYVDFGTTDFGASTVKSVEAIYLGVATDGELYARMESGTSSRLYRVVPRGDMMRAKPAKGVNARLWNVSLEIVDATEFELDLVEIQVGVSSRRWTSR